MQQNILHNSHLPIFSDHTTVFGWHSEFIIFGDNGLELLAMRVVMSNGTIKMLTNTELGLLLLASSADAFRWVSQLPAEMEEINSWLTSWFVLSNFQTGNSWYHLVVQNSAHVSYMNKEVNVIHQKISTIDLFGIFHKRNQ